MNSQYFCIYIYILIHIYTHLYYFFYFIFISFYYFDFGVFHSSWATEKVHKWICQMGSERWKVQNTTIVGRKYNPNKQNKKIVESYEVSV